MNMFNASFSHMPLSSIQEIDDGDDFGLLASHSKHRDADDDDDNFSFQSSHSRRSNGRGNNGGGGNRFKMGKLKGSKLGVTMKKLVPRMPSMPKRDLSRAKSNGGFFMSDDG
jgi:hypothetical protein